MNLDIVYETSVTGLSFAHNQKMEALGGIFFPVILKFLIQIELRSIQKFPPMVKVTNVRNALKRISSPGL